VSRAAARKPLAQRRSRSRCARKTTLGTNPRPERLGAPAQPGPVQTKKRAPGDLMALGPFLPLRRQEHSVSHYACFVVHDPSSHLLRALRQAQLYGYLIARDDGLFYPRGNRALCRLHHARGMVRAGWLVTHGGRYKLISDGRRAAESHGAIASH
jgi:hypothetical protein